MYYNHWLVRMSFDPVYLGIAIAIAVVLLVILCNPCGYGVNFLQRAETIIKKRYGRGQGCCFKWCTILCLMPLYAIMIWMGIVAFGGNVGVEIIDQVCGAEDAGCRVFFSLWLTDQDKDACTSINCAEEDLLARSGSIHTTYAPNLGLGKSLDPVVKDVDYTCETTDSGTGTCVSATGGSSSTLSLCEDPNCIYWEWEADSIVEFTLAECNCTSGVLTNYCAEWTCTELTMPYFYPNVVFSLMMCCLVVFPCMALMCFNTKEQLGKKLIPCTDPEVVGFEQAGGLMSANDLAAGPTGGIAENSAERDRNLGVKKRSFSRYDCLVYIVGITVVSAGTYLMWVASGFVGLILFGCCLVVLVILLGINLCLYLKGREERTKQKIEMMRSS